MADNVTISQGSGTTIATDEVGGYHYQRVKVTLGADGTVVDAIGGAGAVSSAVQRVTLASDDVLVAKLPAALGSGGGLKVDGSGTALPISGTVAATQSGTWNIGTVTTLPALPTGSNVIGGVTQSGTWNIGSITTLPALPTGANVIGAVTQSGTWNVGSITTLPALATGANIIGQVSVNQTTDGTTNKVNIEASLKSGTATRSTVASGTTSATIIAANASRKGVIICNQDANALLLDLSGGTASTTRYQERLIQGQSLDLGNGFTGAVTGIWEADGTGQADVVEFT